MSERGRRGDGERTRVLAEGLSIPAENDSAAAFVARATVRLRSCPKDNSVTNERCRSRLRLEVSFALCNEDLCADVHVSCVMKCVFAKFTEFGSIV